MTSAQRRLEGEEEQLRQVTEALIFAANEPVTADKIARIYMRVSGQEAPTAELIGEVIKHLNKLYDSSGCSLRIYRWGGGYRMATITEVAPYLKEMFSEDRSRKLSRSLMETLSVIAYKQPVSKPEVDFIRGVDSDYAIRKLLEGGLIDLAGRGESVGRPLLYRQAVGFWRNSGWAASMNCRS